MLRIAAVLGLQQAIAAEDQKKAAAAAQEAAAVADIKAEAKAIDPVVAKE